jgi:hypothetical protein
MDSPQGNRMFLHLIHPKGKIGELLSIYPSFIMRYTKLSFLKQF